jgi:predicted RNA-binding protein with PUA-like domain
VRLAYRRTFDQLLSLEALRESFTPEELLVVRRGNRLSILPVADAIAARLMALRLPGP